MCPTGLPLLHRVPDHLFFAWIPALRAPLGPSCGYQRLLRALGRRGVEGGMSELTV